MSIVTIWSVFLNPVTYTTPTCTSETLHNAATVLKILLPSRLTVVSREAKKKQHARASSGLRDHYSELFTRMAALKF